MDSAVGILFTSQVLLLGSKRVKGAWALLLLRCPMLFFWRSSLIFGYLHASLITGNSPVLTQPCTGSSTASRYQAMAPRTSRRSLNIAKSQILSPRDSASTRRLCPRIYFHVKAQSDSWVSVFWKEAKEGTEDVPMLLFNQSHSREYFSCPATKLTSSQYTPKKAAGEGSRSFRSWRPRGWGAPRADPSTTCPWGQDGAGEAVRRSEPEGQPSEGLDLRDWNGTQCLLPWAHGGGWAYRLRAHARQEVTGLSAGHELKSDHHRPKWWHKDRMLAFGNWVWFAQPSPSGRGSKDGELSQQQRRSCRPSFLESLQRRVLGLAFAQE